MLSLVQVYKVHYLTAFLTSLLCLYVAASMDGVILSDDKAPQSPASNPNDDASNLRCQTCSQTFTGLDALYAHQNELGHLELKQTPRGPGYLCWKKGCNQYFKTAPALQMHFREIHMRAPAVRSQHVSVSEKHVYKYRCNHCSLAFKSMEKLQLHSYYHIIRAATKCLVCGRSFRSIAAMRKHVEASHLESMSPVEMEKYRESLAVSAQLGLLMPPNMPHIPGMTPTPASMSVSLPTPASLPTPTSVVVSLPSTTSSMTPTSTPTPTENGESKKIEKMDIDEDSQGSQGSQESDGPEEMINTKALAENSYQDPNCKYKCLRCKVCIRKSKAPGHAQQDTDAQARWQESTVISLKNQHRRCLQLRLRRTLLRSTMIQIVHSNATCAKSRSPRRTFYWCIITQSAICIK